MNTDSIAIKGIRDGLMISPLATLVQDLAGRLAVQGRFFHSGRESRLIADNPLAPERMR